MPTPIEGLLRHATALLAAVLLAGCATTHPWQNQPAVQNAASEQSAVPTTSFLTVVSLSGGGARAAAFGLGVLREMKATRFEWEGRGTTLLDQLSLISGVSGGSILATYYAAFGDEALTGFEEKFLRKDFQGDLLAQVFSAGTYYKLTSPWYGRSNVLGEQLDTLYQGKTFGDLAARKGGPDLLITATDLTTGAPFEFVPEQFELICSELASVPLSFAVASSSAVPILLSPMTLRNYAGACPAKARSAPGEARAAKTRHRRQLLEDNAVSYRNADERPFIHLVDGGLTDNLGVRPLLDRALADGSIEAAFRNAPPGSIRRIVVIVVNSERDMMERVDQSDKVPSTGQVVDALVFGAGSRSTRETLALLNDAVDEWKEEIAASRNRQHSPFAADAEIHLVPVSLQDVEDPEIRRALLQVPTAFSILPAQAGQLIEQGREALRQSPAFRRLLGGLRNGADPAVLVRAAADRP